MIARETLDAARKKGIRVATAESCTGGLVAAALTEVAGSSDVFDRGVVTYSNAAKTDLLGVDPDTLESYGAVSEPVAAEMAHGIWTRSLAQVTVSTTGIAGPGGSDHKPEGRVCFGVATPNGVTTQTVEFGALGRAQVRVAAVTHALHLLRTAIDGL